MSNPPIPFELAKLRGNPGKRRLKPEPQSKIEATCPEAPDWLSAYAAEEWRRIALDLHSVKLLTVIDVMPLAAYCDAYARWRNALEILARLAEKDDKTHALLIRSGDGNPKANPQLRIASRAAQDMVSFASQFGMTPIARARIARGPGWQPPGGGKFDGLLG